MTTEFQVQTDRRSTLSLEARKLRGRRIIGHVIGRIFIHSILILLSLMAIAPVLWMISSSLKASTEVFAVPMQWLPEQPRWANYSDAFAMAPLWLNMWNTAVVSFLAVLGTVVSSAFVAYAFARMEWPGKGFFFALLIATMMLPGIVLLVPRFIMFSKFFPAITGFKWVNTFLPLVIPPWFAIYGFYVFLLRQFFLSIPVELEDAARIDGASTFRILWQIILPLSKPALVTVIIFSFLYHYSDFLEPLIYLNNVNNWTIAVAIRAFNDQYYATKWEIVFASGTFALIPMIIIFFIAQRYFVQGIHLTGFGGR